MPFCGGLISVALTHKVAHTVVPAVLVLVGGFTLRWIMVNAGQMSEIVPVLGMAP